MATGRKTSVGTILSKVQPFPQLSQTNLLSFKDRENLCIRDDGNKVGPVEEATKVGNSYTDEFPWVSRLVYKT